MKKNYIAPSTVAATWASMGLMQDITVAMNSVSGGGVAAPKSTDDMDFIQ